MDRPSFLNIVLECCWTTVSFVDIDPMPVWLHAFITFGVFHFLSFLIQVNYFVASRMPFPIRIPFPFIQKGFFNPSCGQLSQIEGILFYFAILFYIFLLFMLCFGFSPFIIIRICTLCIMCMLFALCFFGISTNQKQEERIFLFMYALCLSLCVTSANREGNIYIF